MNSEQLEPTIGQLKQVIRRAPWISSGISRNSLKTTTLGCGRWRCMSYW